MARKKQSTSRLAAVLAKNQVSSAARLVPASQGLSSLLCATRMMGNNQAARGGHDDDGELSDDSKEMTALEMMEA